MVAANGSAANTEYPNREWLERSNAETLYHLERQGRTEPGVVPFVGAGVSTAYGLKDWRTLLLDAAPPQVAEQVRKHLDEKDYEAAAEALLQELGADGFQNMVAASARDGELEAIDLGCGTVSLLPLLASGPVVTTNFDRILERAFAAHGMPFESVISGPRPDLIVDALHGNRRVLIKLHGDWQDRVGRTFAKSDYDANYGEAQPRKKRELLIGAERLLFSGRSMLFVGASLNKDRTVDLLKEVHDQYAGIRHFTITSIPGNQQAFDEKNARLRGLGVLPLWYHARTPEDHAREVARMVMTIVVRISVRTITVGVPAVTSCTLPPGLPKAAPPAASSHEDSPRPPGLRTTARPPAWEPSLPKLDAHFERIVRLLEDGRLTFFLGSAIHSPTRLLAGEFYNELARVFECQALREDRSAVTQYIADRYGRESLCREIRKLFERTRLERRAVHELFASWGSFRTNEGGALPRPMIVTTNYDDLLESCLHEAGLGYHLFSYQADGPSQGLFYHRTPDDGLRIIERPRSIRRLSEEPFGSLGGTPLLHDEIVMVKLNGGFDHQRLIPESYVTTRSDRWALAARIPDILPAVVRDTLSTKPLLFLGSSLAGPQIESLIRFAHRDHPGSRSWAVVLNKGSRKYWQQCGVEIIEEDVNAYAQELHRRLARNGRQPAP